MSVRFWSCLKVVGFLLLLGSFLPEAEAAQARPAKLSVEYVYAPDGMLAGRTVNGQIQRFEYDKRGQLLAVKDAQGNDLERYVYDPAGNILSKTVHGRTTRFTYDAANQITSRTNPDGSVVQYRYDAAGRLVQEGTRSYAYGYQDKVEEIRENGKTIAKFTYGLDGQLESVTRADGSVEHFYWDGLALLGRGKSTFLNEPYVTGGNPIASDGKAMLNDMLGSTVGIRDGEKMTPVAMTAFGESADPEAMYTGKPHVDGLGYAFLFRNYRAELGKWQTADPLGYPDGWNQMAYVNNGTIMRFDNWGTAGHWIYQTVEVDFVTQTSYNFEEPPNPFITLHIQNPGILVVPIQYSRRDYLTIYVADHCQHAPTATYNPPDDTYNVNIQIALVRNSYDFVDTGAHDGVWAIVKVYSVTTIWRIYGTYQTRSWVEE